MNDLESGGGISMVWMWNIEHLEPSIALKGAFGVFGAVDRVEVGVAVGKHSRHVTARHGTALDPFVQVEGKEDF
ncbi:hypothetical protein AMTR_s00057p00209670 [Amborella trichopoda]|uniref:Uncharacterized protein n=1 Tax=Amborella trichopoda TaxID=13333 RepID=U5D3J0_AMBTC|nr:hypothetical protein AMTR_s00057p00209670 [Amborella trichopoda]